MPLRLADTATRITRPRHFLHGDATKWRRANLRHSRLSIALAALCRGVLISNDSHRYKAAGAIDDGVLQRTGFPSEDGSRLSGGICVLAPEVAIHCT